MKYTSNDIQIIVIHPVVLAGQGGLRSWITLYNIYTNDIVNYIVQGADIILYTEDTTFTLIGSNLPEVID